MFKYKLKENSKFKVGDIDIKGGKKSTITQINPKTGAITWDLEDVGAFDTVYKTFDKLNQLLKTLESEGEAKADLTIDSIASKVKDLFNDYRTHIRINYPKAYERVKLVKESEQSQWDAIDVSRTAEKELSYKEWNERTAKKLAILKSLNDAGKFKKKWDDEKLQGWVDKNYSWEKVSLQSVKEEEVDEGEGIGYMTPKAFDKNKKSTGANDIYYYKLGYKPVPKKIKGAGTIVKQLWEKEELTEYNDFQQKRIGTFDEVEEKLNLISPLLSNAKNKTAKYYNENPGSYAIVYSTDMISELLSDITELLKQEE